MNRTLLCVGSILPILWGIAHLFPTRKIAEGFGDISRDNRLTFVMEWLAAAFGLIFIGALVLLVTLLGGSNLTPAHAVVYWASASVLVALAVLSLFTGTRTSVPPMKLCPVIELTSAVLIILGLLFY
jgi:hypothetical protein